MIGWAIDRDYIANPDETSRVGWGQLEVDALDTENSILRRIEMSVGLKASEVEQPVRFRLMDEDGEVHYGGAVSYEWVAGADDHAYNIVEFGMADTGATDVQFRAEDLGEAMVERHRAINCSVTDGGTEWIIVYG